MQQREVAAAHPRVVAQALDGQSSPTQLRLVPGSYVDDKLSDLPSDVLFSATLAGRPVLLYLLLEHSCGACRDGPFRLASTSLDLSAFLRRYPLQKPRLEPANEDEVRRLNQADGVRHLEKPPAEADHRGVPEKKGDPGCHLWVVSEEGVPYLLERAAVASELKSGVVKHTNLTGGGLAASGGELWVDPADDGRLYLNGCSGRYGPTTEDQLTDVVRLVAALGFYVESFGWDHDANRPSMVRRP